MLKILAQILRRKKKSSLNYRLGSWGSIMVPLHFFVMGAVDGGPVARESFPM